MWNRMLEELPQENCFMIFDETQQSIEQGYYSKPEKIFLHTENDCKNLNKLHDMIYNTVESSICFTKLSGPIWVLENDLYFNGNMSKILGSVDCKGDFMATHIRKYKEDPTWSHFPRLVGDISSIPMEQRIASLFSIVWCSSKMIQLLHENLGKSSGYCEVYFTALAPETTQLPDSIIGVVIPSVVKPPNSIDDKVYHKYILE